jgi:hypothetical protein
MDSCTEMYNLEPKVIFDEMFLALLAKIARYLI